MKGFSFVGEVSATSRTLIVIFSVLILSTNALAISGIICDEEWSGEVLLTGDVTIPGGCKLTILPGTVIKAQPDTDDQQGGVDPERIEIIVDGGTLVAKGSADQRIVFTSAAADEKKEKGDWYGLRFITASASTVVQYCTVQYGVNGVSVEQGTLSNIEQWTVENCSENGVSFVSGATLTDCTICNNGKYGVWLQQAGRLSQCTVSGNGDDGVHGTADYTTVIEGQSRIESNTGDGFEGGSITARDSQFLSNKEYGIYVSSKPTSAVVSCTLNSNGMSGLYAYGDSISNRGITVSNTNVSGNGNNGLSVKARAGSYAPHSDGWRLTFSGNTITGNGNHGIRLLGKSGASTGINNWKVTIHNNVINGNGRNAVLFYGGDSGTVEGWALTIAQNQMQNNGDCGILFRYELGSYEGLSWKNWSVEVTDNNRVLSNGGDGIGMSGTLRTGASINTANWNMKVSGNFFQHNGRHGVNLPGDGTWTADIADNSIQASGRSGVYVVGAKSLSIQQNCLHDNVEAGIWLASAPALVDMTLNTISGESVYGVRIDSAAKEIEEVTGMEYNNFVNDGLYVFDNGSATGVVAPNNYWGTTDESEIEGKIHDCKDDDTLGCVNYKPFLTEPPPGCEDSIAPAAVTSLSLFNLTSNSVTLKWTAPGDDGNVGTAAQYDIRYSTSEITDENSWNAAIECEDEPAPQPAGSEETFKVTDLSPFTIYYFALKTADEVPNWSDLSNVAVGKTTAKTGDVSGDETVSAYDAALILQYVVGLRDDFPVDTMTSPSTTAPRNYVLSLPSLTVKANGRIQAPIAINDAGLTAGVLSLKYDATILKAVSVTPQMLLNGSYWQANTDLDGEVRFAFASAEPTKGQGNLLIVEFEVLPNTEGKTSPLTLDNIDLSNSLTITRINGSVTVLPSKFALLQNYPNPFNPETWIPFKLAQDASVTIRIYNTEGKLIRAITLGSKQAGIYITKDAAAYFSGRDSFGEKVASGIYFYTLQAGEFRATRKMVIVK